jgi:hypothetical protein
VLSNVAKRGAGHMTTAARDGLVQFSVGTPDPWTGWCGSPASRLLKNPTLDGGSAWKVV